MIGLQADAAELGNSGKAEPVGRAFYLSSTADKQAEDARPAITGLQS